METIVWAKIGSSLIYKCRLAEHSTFKSIFSSSLPGTYLNQWLLITCRLRRVVTSFSKQLFVTQCGWFQYLSPLMPTCTFASAVNLSFVLCKKKKKIMHVRILFFTNYRKIRYKQERQPCMYAYQLKIHELGGRLSIPSNAYSWHDYFSSLQRKIK